LSEQPESSNRSKKTFEELSMEEFLAEHAKPAGNGNG